MAYFVLVLILLLFIVLFLYVQLRKDVREVTKQLQYTRDESSSFKFFSSSSNKHMKNIVEEINIMREEKQRIKCNYLEGERQTQEMIANISHDIRTPLTSIQGYVEMMEYSNQQSERERYYQVVSERLHDLESMLDEFFVYTKLLSMQEGLVLDKKEIYPIVCKSLINYIDLLKAHELEPEIRCDDEGICAKVHEESLQRVCMNLIINAIRYGMSMFCIELKKEKENAIITFKNECMKSSLVDTQHMFDRFYKGSQARTQKGSGLGLAIVAELIEHMNGKVDALYENNILTIRIMLPLA